MLSNLLCDVAAGGASSASLDPAVAKEMEALARGGVLSRTDFNERVRPAWTSNMVPRNAARCIAIFMQICRQLLCCIVLHADHDAVGHQNLAVTEPDCVNTPTLPQVVDALRCLPQEAALRALNHLAQAVSSIQISTVRRCAAQCIPPAICRAQDACVPSRRVFTHDAARTSWIAAMACHPPRHLCHLT